MINYKERLRDPFSYVCLIAIIDSFRFYKDLPFFLDSLPLYQEVWLPNEWFQAIVSPLVVLALLCCALGTATFLFAKSKRLTYQLLFWGYFLSSFIHFHYYKFYHRSHLLIYCLFILAFSWRTKNQLSAHRLIQKITILIYGMTGTWKAYYVIKSYLASQSFSFMSEVLPRHIAHFFLVDYEFNRLGLWLLNSPQISSVLFLCIIFVQLSGFYIINKPRFFLLWGCAILSFHLGTYLFLNILFWQMILIVLIFFVFFRYERKIDNI